MDWRPQFLQSANSFLRLSLNKPFFWCANFISFLGQPKLNWFGSVTSSGGEVFEQTGVVNYQGQTCRCRHVVVQLEQATRDAQLEASLKNGLLMGEQEQLMSSEVD